MPRTGALAARVSPKLRTFIPQVVKDIREFLCALPSFQVRNRARFGPQPLRLSIDAATFSTLFSERQN